MGKIYLVCSAQTESEIFRIAQGWSETNLSLCGLSAAKVLAEELAKEDIEAIYSSDLYGARASAHEISKACGIDYETESDLREICLGEWERQSWGNIAQEYPAMTEAFNTRSEHFKVRDAQSFAEVKERLNTALIELSAVHAGNIVVVSHRIGIELLTGEYVLGGEVYEAEVNNSSNITCKKYINNRIEAAVAECYKDREADFDTDMAFFRLRWIEYSQMLVSAMDTVWEESGRYDDFDEELLLSDASSQPTMMGFVEQKPVGFYQTNMDNSWISFLILHPECRRLGIGTQMLGRIVTDAAAMGEESVCIAVPEANPHTEFFLSNGFLEMGTIDEDKVLWEKNILLRDLED